MQKIELDAPLTPSGHPFPATVDGVDYIYFPVPYPSIRVKADLNDVMDLSSYEAFTPLAPATRYDEANTKLDIHSMFPVRGLSHRGTEGRTAERWSLYPTRQQGIKDGGKRV